MTKASIRQFAQRFVDEEEPRYVWSEPELSAEEEAELAPVVKVRAQIHPLRPNAAAIYRSNAAAIYRSISTAGSCARARVCVCVCFRTTSPFACILPGLGADCGWCAADFVCAWLMHTI